MKQLTAAILDDELYGRENLCFMLETFFPEIKVVGKFSNIRDAEVYLKQNNPEILFLDIRLENEMGFNLLENQAIKPTAIIIVSGYDQYGIAAIKHNVVDYILKPIHEEDFKNAVVKAKAHINSINQDFNADRNVIRSKLRIPTLHGFELLEISTIKRLQANGNYTDIFFMDGTSLIVSKSMKEFEPFLDNNVFYRIHRSHIINLNYIKGYNSKEGGYVILMDNSLIEISRSKHKNFMDFIANKFNSIS